MKKLKGFPPPDHYPPFTGSDLAHLITVSGTSLFLWSRSLSYGASPLHDPDRVYLLVDKTGTQGVAARDIYRVSHARKSRLYSLADAVVISRLGDSARNYEILQGHYQNPRYEHDCPRCAYLGPYDFDGPLAPVRGKKRSARIYADLYVCSADEGTLIVRAGNGGPDYASMPVESLERNLKHMEKNPSTHGPGLIEAHRRHRERLEAEEAEGNRVAEVIVTETNTVLGPEDWPERKLFLRNRTIIGYSDTRGEMSISTGPMPGWGEYRLGQWLARDDTGKHPEVVRTIQVAGGSPKTARDSKTLSDMLTEAEARPPT